MSAARIRTLKAHLENLQAQRDKVNEIADKKLELIGREIEKNEATMAELDAVRLLREIKKHNKKEAK